MEKIKAQIIDPQSGDCLATTLVDSKFWAPSFPAKIYYAGQVLNSSKLKEFKIEEIQYIQVRKIF